MVFSSLYFLFVFLPATLLAYYACPPRGRNWVALAASLFFYAWGAPRFIFVLIGSCLADFWLGHRLREGAARRRGWLALGLAVNVGVLVYFKYANFLVAQVNAILAAAGAGPLPWAEVALPIGISFFTFQKISYLMDVYRGGAVPAPTFHHYLLYVALFPQLIAGPIVRYHDVAAQLVRRAHSFAKMASGVRRFCLGLGKKVLVANILAEVADRAFAIAPAELTPGYAWVGVLCYAFQIYFDFSGYSDMALGLGRMLGFEFLENFDRPYISRNFTEFWRRWHISLSNFMREYLYIPLCGNRQGEWRTYLNLWIVFVISGFWHGAAWNFVVWGGYHGLFLSLDKLLRPTRLSRLPGIVAVPGTFMLVLFSWVLFRANTLAHAAAYLRCMLLPWTGADRPALPPAEFMDPFGGLTLAVAAAVCFIPAVPAARSWLDRVGAAATPGSALALAVGSILLLVCSAMALAAGTFNPFIYFRF